MADNVVSAVQLIYKAGREAVKKAAESASSAKALAHVFKALSIDEKGVITGIGGAAGDINKVDLDKEFIEKADLMDLAFDFCGSANRSFKANHTDDLGADLVESWVGAPIIKDGDAVRVLKADEVLDDKMEVVGISTEKGAETHWFVGVRPHDQKVVEAAKAGELAGFSFSAIVTKTVVA